MNPEGLKKRFAVPGLAFDEKDGLTRVLVDVPEAKAAIYLQGAHLTDWQPEGFEPAILLSSKSAFGVGKPIRGGIPIAFPWFANDSKQDRVDGHPGPQHGFARIQDWELVAAKRVKDGMQLEFTQGPTEMSRSMGYDNFGLKMEFYVGRELTLAMTVANTGKAAMSYEQAFHPYYKVADIHELQVSGLEATSFIDKTDGYKVKPAAGAPIRFTKTEDRVYNNTAATCTIADVAGRRRFTAEKKGSNSTVVWNSGAPLADLGEWDWHEYVAVETANVGVNAVTLEPGARAAMGLHVRLEKA
jgi:glucose-6-phosphate 1-epimerase